MKALDVTKTFANWKPVMTQKSVIGYGNLKLTPHGLNVVDIFYSQNRSSRKKISSFFHICSTDP